MFAGSAPVGVLQLLASVANLPVALTFTVGVQLDFETLRTFRADVVNASVPAVVEGCYFGHRDPPQNLKRRPAVTLWLLYSELNDTPKASVKLGSSVANQR